MIKRKTPGRAAAAGARGENVAEDSALARVRELARIATEFELGEIEFEPSGRIRISRLRAPAVAAAAAAPVAAPAAAAAPAPSLVKATPAEDENAVFIMSPFVGTFYRAPSPDASPFVDAGSAVRKGQVVCIIEAMKLMNEIESEVEGKIVEVLAKNGEHVEYGQKLFRVSKA
jgi:acetyl-CoA carboxylase biotin carboxyl carrier protein